MNKTEKKVMLKIKLMTKIAKVGTDMLSPEKYEIGDSLQNEDAIMARSAALHDLAFGENLRAIARCGAGVNNIPVDKCTKAGIVVFNTPGANANAVKELAIAALILASRDIVGGIDWARTLAGQTGVAKAVEAGKSAFVGHELAGKTLGVIGLGAIGGLVANAAIKLGMRVVGCDPFLSVDAAWNIDQHVVKAASFDDVFAVSDYVTLHVPATKDTKGMISAESIAKMKDGVKIINLARADLVVADDVKCALESVKVSAYVTDFPTAEVLGVNGIVTIPHLGASTEESEDNCAIMACDQMRDYLEDGNIKNSVNFPNTAMPRTGDARLCILHTNIPAVISKITASVSSRGVNIENMLNRSKGQYACTLLDITGEVPEATVRELCAIEGVLRVRVL